MATVLIRAGHGQDPVVRGALSLCHHVFNESEGFECFVLDESIQPACVMTVPLVLRALLALPPQLRTRRDRALISGMVRLLKQFHLHRYVPTERQAWLDWAGGVTASERRIAKPEWVATGRTRSRTEKQSWLRFSFPLGYNPDLLEVLLQLGAAGAKRDDIVDEGLDVVLGKRGKDGMWRMTGGLNGKMHANLDQKGKPSPWITYRALLAFKRFGLLRIQ